MHGSELIFLAEDDGSGRERVRSALIHFGYRVLSASNDEVALRLCEKETPSVAMLDVVMVHVGGTATAVEPLPGLPILFTRGHRIDRKLRVADSGIVSPSETLPCYVCRVDHSPSPRRAFRPSILNEKSRR